MSDPGGVPPEIDGKLRQFRRILMSYIDFQQAAGIAGHLLDQDLYAGYPRSNRLLVQALNVAAIVTYCRPFSGNDGGAARIPDLPGWFLRLLTDDERHVHEVVMEERNTALAHSDADAWQMTPEIVKVGKAEILVPMHHDVHALLLPEAMRTLRGMAVKVLEATFAERKRLEAELKPYLPVVEYEGAVREHYARELGGALDQDEGRRPTSA